MIATATYHRDSKLFVRSNVLSFAMPNEPPFPPAAKTVGKGNISEVVSTGTRMAKKKVGPALKKLMESVSKDLRRAQMPRKERLLEIMKRATETSLDDIEKLVKGTKTALKTLEIDFKSTLPKFHNFGLLGAGVGLGITRNFGTIHVLRVEG